MPLLSLKQTSCTSPLIVRVILSLVYHRRLNSLTHGPPFGVFDRVMSGERVGCEALASHISQLRPRLHLFGHIHEDHGAMIHKWPFDDQGNSSETVFVNGANWPMGRNTKTSSGSRVQFGTGPFAPVIVDLKDSV